MTLYAVGDIQGCYRAFATLLDRLRFDPARDRLWLVGDLVNRGPDSLSVLRRVAELGASATTVLGNHDLHLLAAAAGVRRPSRGDTLQQVLDAPDADELIDWLRRRPLLHYDRPRDRVLVHAGIPAAWDVDDALANASEVEALLRGPHWRYGLEAMYGNDPPRWTQDLEYQSRVRYTINALTRMRFCDRTGALDLERSGPPGSQPPELVPWFEVPGRKAAGTHIVFGHWSALGFVRRAELTALDTGCVWGGELTAVALDEGRDRTAVDCKEEAAPRG
ncbi:MAG TPA: symmetrical bis(5'-nucleosyl)-tetraphosphatase [Gammaproteobacteria bacterium]|nr:symmetrical bis(5'-nucleosyl)-tetraphosphatase [Gammaproteobacteria bacterium]